MKTMRSNPIFLAIGFAFILFAPYIFIQSAPAVQLIGTYEVSYMYNSMGDPNNLNRPMGSMEYNSIWSAPIEVTLAPGDYFTKFVTGRITGNDFYDYGYKGYKDAYDAYVPILNPGSVYPATGFNGGNTDPTNNDPALGWWNMVAGWVGTSETVGSVFWGGTFVVNPGQSLWLYWTDPWIYDNLGGVTVEVWQTASAPVPEPATMLLIGSGLIGLAGYGRKKFFKK